MMGRPRLCYFIVAGNQQFHPVFGFLMLGEKLVRKVANMLVGVIYAYHQEEVDLMLHNGSRKEHVCL